MGPSFLITAREGFEAALVVAIVFAYLRRTDRLDLACATWFGIVAAVGVSALVGTVVHLTIGTFTGDGRLRTFAAISLAAASVLTWMVFWMRRLARNIRGELEHRVARALDARRVGFAVGLVAFLAVLREGIETALFLMAAATEENNGAIVVGGLAGLAVAVVLGALAYAGGRRVPLRAFFSVTGMVLVVFAAGLLARTVSFLQLSGDLTTVDGAVYDLTAYDWLTQETEIGRFLAAMFGWDPRPSIEQILVWALYLVPVGFLFLRGVRSSVSPEHLPTGSSASGHRSVPDKVAPT
jgi:high-affinity iron transporter